MTVPNAMGVMIAVAIVIVLLCVVGAVLRAVGGFLFPR